MCKSESDKKHYVYVHKYASGPKKGQVFYVGKGVGRRSKNRSKRNQHWKNIVKKHGFTDHIICSFSRLECAFSFEIALIKKYGRDNLCNMTDGGEGVRGYTYTNEHRENLSKALRETDAYPSSVRSQLARINWLNEEYRRKCTEAQIKRMSDPILKSEFDEVMSSDEVRLKLSSSAKRRYETDRKLRDTLIKNNNRRMKSVVCLSNNMVFKSVSDAARWLRSNGSPKAATSPISKCCNGKYAEVYGHKWEYINEI